LKLNILYLVVFDGGEEEECCYIKKSQEEWKWIITCA
jgi:hypothetical protein